MYNHRLGLSGLPIGCRAESLSHDQTVFLVIAKTFIEGLYPGICRPDHELGFANATLFQPFLGGGHDLPAKPACLAIRGHTHVIIPATMPVMADHDRGGQTVGVKPEQNFCVVTALAEADVLVRIVVRHGEPCRFPESDNGIGIAVRNRTHV